MSVKHSIAAYCAIILGLPACSGTSDLILKSERLAQQRNYYQAYWVIANATETYPNDPELQRVFWERRKEYLLDRGQELLFRERELDAIAELQKVLATDPDNRTAKAMIKRANIKLATRAVSQGEQMRYLGKLEEALKVYNEATSYVPEFPPAVAGIKEVNQHYEDLAKKAFDHYLLGSRARGEYPPSYVRSWYHSGLAQDLDNSLSRAKRLHKASARRIAEDRFAAAQRAQEDGFHAAALSEYKAIELIVPDLAGLKQRIATCTKEVEARRICRAAEMLLRKGQFDAADEKLAEAFETAIGGDVKAIVSGAMADSRRRRYKEVYLLARDKQLEWQLEEALVDYQAIDKVFANQGGFEDVAERIAEVTSAIAEATDAWQKGKAAEDKGEFKAAIDSYAEAIAVYKGFKDLEAKIGQLRARLK